LLNAQDEGRRAESRFATRLGLKLTSQSGAGVRFKLDAGNARLLGEYKWTGAASYVLRAKDILKALRGARGPGSRDQVMVFVVEMKDAPEPIWCFQESDALALARGELTLDLSHRPTDVRRAGAEPAYE
jgi:hypothetical protein